MSRHNSSMSAGAKKSLLNAELGVYEDEQLLERVIGIPNYILKMTESDGLFAEGFCFAPFVVSTQKSEAELAPIQDLAVGVSKQEAQKSLYRASVRAITELQSSISRTRHFSRTKPDKDYAGVVVASVGESAAFQSTWYSRHGFRRILRVAGLGKKDRFEINLRDAGWKGFIVEVQPAEEARGLFTALNNTIGCVHLSHQLKELRKIVEILKGKAPREAIERH